MTAKCGAVYKNNQGETKRNTLYALLWWQVSKQIWRKVHLMDRILFQEGQMRSTKTQRQQKHVHR